MVLFLFFLCRKENLYTIFQNTSNIEVIYGINRDKHALSLSYSIPSRLLVFISIEYFLISISNTLILYHVTRQHSIRTSVNYHYTTSHWGWFCYLLPYYIPLLLKDLFGVLKVDTTWNQTTKVLCFQILWAINQARFAHKPGKFMTFKVIF